MDCRERLKKAMKGEATDRPPVICPGGMMNLVVEAAMETSGVYWPEAHTEGEAMAKLSSEMFRQGGFENYGVPFCMTVEAEALGAPITLGTIQTEPRITDYCLKNSKDWKQLKSIDFSQGRTRTVLEAIGALKQLNQGQPSAPIIGNLTGPISLATSLVDPNTFYREMRKDPEAVHGLLGFLTDELLAFGQAQLDAGADLIAISDPSATGEILGPKLFETFVVPYLNRLTVSLGQNAEMGTMVHICGRLSSIYEPLNQLACPILSFDAITSVAQVKAHVIGKVLMGNVSTYTLEFGDEDQVEKLAASALKAGVGILAPACGVGTRTALSNIRRLRMASEAFMREKEGQNDAI